MPTTLAALLILVFGFVPGVLGETIYSAVAGRDWREHYLSWVLRVIIASVSGLAIYALVAPLVRLPLPLYLSPLEMADAYGVDVLPSLAVALVGHSVGAAVAGFLGGIASTKIQTRLLVSIYPDTYMRFVRDLTPEHWVVVSLTTGDSYAGMVERADVSVDLPARDLVLREPALYHADRGRYVSLNYQYVYFPGRIIDSVAIVHEPATDKRVTAVGSDLFASADNEQPPNTAEQA